MPKSRMPRAGTKSRSSPLEKQLAYDASLKFAKSKKKAVKADEDDTNTDMLTNSKDSSKILQFAREQMEEENVANKEPEVELDSEDDDEDEGEYLATDQVAALGMSEAEERALEMFMSSNTTKRRTLGEIIMEKMQQREQMQDVEQTNDQDSGMSPQMIEVFTSVGKILSRYRAGKVPKAFKIIPSLKNWEDVLFLTEPESWSPQAMLVATRLFASNLNAKMAQRYNALVLLPAVQEDIRGNKVLNYHLYMSLKKALYKPAAFFKGILLPLCESGCTLREGAIVASVLAKVSIPMLHSAAAMLKIAQMPYSGATSVFLTVLMNKRYNLPYKVIDALLNHFLTFTKEKRKLPVLWHQSILVFAQRYKSALSAEQKEALKPLLRIHSHKLITPEIRRELFFSASRAG